MLTTLPETAEPLSEDELRQIWVILTTEERLAGFRLLPHESADDFFQELAAHERADLLDSMTPAEQRMWLRHLAPDDAVDVLQIGEPKRKAERLALLDEATRREVTALLAYAEDAAGGLMSPRFARVRPDTSVDEAIGYLRRQARNRLETLYYAYVLDAEQRLHGVISFRELFAAGPDQRISEVMESDVLSVSETMDQEEVARIMAQHDLVALPVVDAEGRMKGIVTHDDIIDVVTQEATEDMHKIGGLEALEVPYLQTGFFEMVRKRAVWLVVLFLGEMLTTLAMDHYQAELARVLVLAVFLPLIISSGGNSGSQASTLVIRAMALGEVKLRDWWRIIRREFASGMVLGAILASIGLARVLIGQALFDSFGPHHVLVALTVALALFGVVTWGTLSGSMLPFVLRRLGADPASASAPMVATLVDVMGLVIYFGIARMLFASVVC